MAEAQLAPNRAELMDNQWAVFNSLNIESYDFLTLEKTQEVKNDLEPKFAFGFDVAFRRANVDISHER